MDSNILFVLEKSIDIWFLKDTGIQLEICDIQKERNSKISQNN